jgi:ribosome-associated protein
MPRSEQDSSRDEGQEGPSKSEVKRRMLALQQLGESLIALNDKQLAQIPIADERLLTAIHETRQIRSNSARKRHLQFIGKLMRGIDPQPIENALRTLHRPQQESNEVFHQLEQLREAILAAGPEGVELAMQRWPQADRQQLRQLVLQHQREVKNNKPPAASRRLFRYLRELQDLYGTSP